MGYILGIWFSFHISTSTYIYECGLLRSFNLIFEIIVYFLLVSNSSVAIESNLLLSNF